MTDTLTPLTSAELADLKAKAKAATPGPYFAAEDEAFDCPNHRKSGLALVDTGRREDWPIARLCEWKQAHFTVAANPETILRLITMVERRDEQIIELREVIEAGMLLADLVERPYFKQKCREALAATEPPK